jgi:hypothetical protein
MFARIRAAWRALWNSTAALPIEAHPEPRPAPAPAAEEEEEKPRRIHSAALWEAGRTGAADPLPELLLKRAEPMPGVLPSGMALDTAMQPVDAMTAWAMSQAFHEGIGFLGYPYLAELSQRAEYRKIASIWAEHCTRKWIRLKGDKEKVDQIEAALEDLHVRDVFREAIEKECYFGRIQVFMDFGDWNDAVEVASGSSSSRSGK